VAASIGGTGYLRKWPILGIAIWVIAGLGAVAFYLALDYAGRGPSRW
jgi:CIC family chloride channel protein